MSKPKHPPLSSYEYGVFAYSPATRGAASKYPYTAYRVLAIAPDLVPVGGLLGLTERNRGVCGIVWDSGPVPANGTTPKSAKVQARDTAYRLAALCESRRFAAAAKDGAFHPLSRGDLPKARVLLGTVRASHAERKETTAERRQRELCDNAHRAGG